MIIKNRSSDFSYMRRVMALPLLVILFCAFAFKGVNRYSFEPNVDKKAAGRITVVIDAGHGGIDAGIRGMEGHTEKDLTLSIARKIKKLGQQYDVDVILTRDNDVLPGNALNIKDGLVNRTSIAESSKADLFISIHISGAGADAVSGSTSGFDIYVSGLNKQFEKSKLLASAVSGEIMKTYKIAKMLKESNVVWVLKATSVPAILIECGFITDKTDLDFITSDQNQEKIANDILRGIVNYHRGVVPEPHSGKHTGQADTLPAGALAKINSGDTLSMTVNNDVIVIKFKNGDSVITSTKELEAYRARRQQDPYNKVFTSVEVEASFPGGPGEWLRYLNKTISYPREAMNKNIQGTVVVQFIVDTEGNVSNIEAISGPTSGGLRKEAVRVIRQSGKWTPGQQNGHTVKSYKKQPLTFMLGG